MSKEKLGQSPAFSQPTFVSPEGTVETAGAYYGEDACGMTKRYWTACMAMQGLLAHQDLDMIKFSFEEVIPKLAFMYADELLKQEDE